MPSDSTALRFLVDMGVSGGLVEHLRSRGHDVVHARDEGLLRASDEDIFHKAASDDRIVITWDLDFGEIAHLTGARKTSIIVLRLRDTRTGHVQDRLDKVLESCRDALLAGAVIAVEESRCRVRYLPVGQEPDP